MALKNISLSIYKLQEYILNICHTSKALFCPPQTRSVHQGSPCRCVRWRSQPSSLTEVLQILVVCLDFMVEIGGESIDLCRCGWRLDVVQGWMFILHVMLDVFEQSTAISPHTSLQVLF